MSKPMSCDWTSQRVTTVSFILTLLSGVLKVQVLASGGSQGQEGASMSIHNSQPTMFILNIANEGSRTNANRKQHRLTVFFSLQALPRIKFHKLPIWGQLCTFDVNRQLPIFTVERAQPWNLPSVRPVMLQVSVALQPWF
jgi:hypothetical protein